MKIIPNVTVQHGKNSFPPGEECELPDAAAKDLVDRGFAKASGKRSSGAANPKPTPAPSGPPSNPPADDPASDPPEDPEVDPPGGQ